MATMATQELISEHFKSAAATYHTLTKNVESLSSVKDQLKKTEEEVNNLTANLNERLEFQRLLHDLFEKEKKQVPLKSDHEAFFWIERRHQQCEALILEQIKVIANKVDESTVKRKELQNSRDKLHNFEEQLANLYSTTFDGENIEFPMEDLLENEVKLLDEQILIIEKEIPLYERSATHLRECRNVLSCAIVTLQSIHDGTFPATSSLLSDNASFNGSDTGTKSSFHTRYSSTPTSPQSTSPPLKARSNSSFDFDVRGDIEHATVTYSLFQKILSDVSSTQSKLQLAASLTPKLPDISTINIVENMPFKDADFAKEGVGRMETRKDAKASYSKILDSLLTFHTYLETTLPDLINQTDLHISDSKARLTATRASYDHKKTEMVAERRRIFETTLAQTEDGSRGLEVPPARMGVSPSSSKAVVIEEGGKSILVGDNTAVVMLS